MSVELNFNPAPEPRCKHCGRAKGRHQARTGACPIGRGSFPTFSTTQFFEARAVRRKSAAKTPAPPPAPVEVLGRDYPLPLVTVDAVLLTLREGRLQVALHRRPADGVAGGKLALPGGFVHVRDEDAAGEEDADVEAAVQRVLLEKTGFQPRYVEQLQVFSGRERDPRRWSVSIAFLALVPVEELALARAGVFHFYDADQLPDLAFDHAEIVAAAVHRVRAKSSYSALPAMLLPERFTLYQLQATYEALLHTTLDKSSFRRRLELWDMVEPLEEYQMGVHRPAQLYRLKDFVLFDKSLG